MAGTFKITVSTVVPITSCLCCIEGVLLRKKASVTERFIFKNILMFREKLYSYMADDNSVLF